MIPLSWRNSGRRRQRDAGNPCCPGATSGTLKVVFSVYVFDLFFFLKSKGSSFAAPTTRVADPHHFITDPDPTFHFSADPDPTFHFSADPDPALH